MAEEAKTSAETQAEFGAALALLIPEAKALVQVMWRWLNRCYSVDAHSRMPQLEPSSDA